jgi:hypothetical protein
MNTDDKTLNRINTKQLTIFDVVPECAAAPGNFEFEPIEPADAAAQGEEIFPKFNTLEINLILQLAANFKRLPATESVPHS